MNTTIFIWRAIDFNSLSSELKEDLKKLNKSSTELFIHDLKDTISSLTYDEDSRKEFLNREVITYKNINGDDINYNFIVKNSIIYIQSSSLYDGYICYCKYNGEKPTSNEYFGFDLKNKFNIERKEN